MSENRTSRTPGLAEVIKVALDSAFNSLYVSIPGRITKYEKEHSRATVKPLVKRRLQNPDGTELLEELPPIPGVPVHQLRAGGFILSAPAKEGDLVTLLFADRSIDAWLAGDGSDTDPNDFRTHDLSDAVAILGLTPFGQIPERQKSESMVVGSEEGLGVAFFKKDTVNFGAEDAKDSATLDSKVQAELKRLAADVNNLKTIFSTWTPVVQDGGGALKIAAAGSLGVPALPGSWAGSSVSISGTESEIVKIEK